MQLEIKQFHIDEERRCLSQSRKRQKATLAEPITEKTNCQGQFYNR